MKIFFIILWFSLCFMSMYYYVIVVYVEVLKVLCINLKSSECFHHALKFLTKIFILWLWSYQFLHHSKSIIQFRFSNLLQVVSRSLWSSFMKFIVFLLCLDGFKQCIPKVAKHSACNFSSESWATGSWSSFLIPFFFHQTSVIS